MTRLTILASNFVFYAVLGLFTFLFSTVTLAQNAPAPNQYILSGANGGTFTVDDGLIVSINGGIVFTDGSASSTTSHPPVSFSANPGDTLTTAVNDTFGFCTSLTPLYLSCKGGSTYVQADPGFNLGCGRPGGNQGIVHTNNFTIPTSLNCTPITIDEVEVTQAIQQAQSIADLQATLTLTGEPPVPIIAGKPAVMRVYFSEVTSATTVTLQLDGVSSISKTVDLQPDCDSGAQRAHENGCPSVDLYFTPPTGAWTATLTLKDSSGNQLDQQILNITSRSTQPIHMISASVCDSQDPLLHFFWQCGGFSDLIGKESLLTTIMPTTTVTFDVGTNKAMEDVNALGFDPWLDKAVGDVNAFYSPLDRFTDTLLNQHSLYFGTYRASVGTTGVAVLGGRGGMTGSTVPRFNADATVPVVAHEVTHTLGLAHTNTNVPATNNSPGCYNFAGGTNYWPYADNYIRSDEGTEYGFNVSTQSVIDPHTTFELMGYCIPRWLSPVGYTRVAATLASTTPLPNVSGGRATALQVRPRAQGVPGTYIQVSGSIAGATVTFRPFFTDTLSGSTDAGTGTYSIVLLDTLGQPLFTRYFTPVVPQTDTETGADLVFPAVFSEWVPVITGTASISIMDSNNTTIGTMGITGPPPTVTLTSPTSGFSATGKQPISWTINPACTTLCTTRVLYSPDGGTTWSQLGQVTDTTLIVDFSTLAGSTGAGSVVKILVSDGARTTSITSPTFQVGKHVPSFIQIYTPASGFAQAAADPVQLSGAVYDAEDGMLHGTSLAWTSDVQGPLGTGSPLSVSLQAGAHKLTLTGTDSDGNAVSASVNVTIGGARPALTLTTAALSSTCLGATVSALPGNKGAALSKVQYSLTGGGTYTDIPLTLLPYSFVLPGSGSFTLVARAYDVSNQSAAASTALSITTPCVTGTPAISGGNTQKATVGSAFTTPLSVLVTDGLGNPVQGATVTFTAPSSGATATLSAPSAVTGANGMASVNAVAGTTAGSYTVSASVVGFASPVTYNLTNTDFTLTADSTTLTVTHGSTVTSTYTIAPLGGFSSAVTFACTGLPSGVTCSFAPASVTPTSGNVTTVLTVTATNDAKAPTTAENVGFGTGVLVALCLCSPGLRRRKRYVGLLAMIGLAAVLANTTGCGASFTAFNSKITVTATAGSLVRSQAITINVQ